MSSVFGERIRISVFGQSHGPKIGCVLDGLPAGEEVDEEALYRYMARRAPGKTGATARRETDLPHIVSGLMEGKTCGAPLCVLIDNADAHSGDYAQFQDIPRPGHADYPAHVKWNGFQDYRGGGHFSARLTAPVCAAGGILAQMFARRGIMIGAHVLRAGTAQDTPFDPMNVSDQELSLLAERYPQTLSEQAGQEMLLQAEKARALGDSIGGVVECAVLHLPAGLGEPMFDGLENRLAQAVFAVPAVKGLEFGEGFAAAGLTGSVNNDAYRMKDGRVTLSSNHAGGILGGLSTGAPVIFRAAFKPTPSIAQPQLSVSLSRGENAELSIRGRHDPCVALRAAPCVEAAAAIALADFIL